MLVRALYRTVALKDQPAPYDRLSCKVFYPAHYAQTDTERNTGLLPIIKRHEPYPVVIFFNGMNIEKSGYQWLAERLVKAGNVVVLFDYVAEVFGMVSLTPGIDLNAVSAGQYGTKPTSATLPALLDALESWNTDPLLAGMLSTASVILGGHSAGGTVALQNANPKWFGGVKGAFAYGAHTMASTVLGYEAGTILPVAPESAYLLLGGTADGVIKASAGRYGDHDMGDPIIRTFEEAIEGGRGDCYAIMLKDATHFDCVYPQDTTTGRHFLEEGESPERAHAEYRELIAHLVSAFVRQIHKHDTAISGTHPLIAQIYNK